MDYRGGHHIDRFGTVNVVTFSEKFPPHSGAFSVSSSVKGLDDGTCGETIIEDFRRQSGSARGVCRPGIGRWNPVVGRSKSFYLPVK
jgi:hypothetical protein